MSTPNEPPRKDSAGTWLVKALKPKSAESGEFRKHDWGDETRDTLPAPPPEPERGEVQ